MKIKTLMLIKTGVKDLGLQAQDEVDISFILDILDTLRPQEEPKTLKPN